MLQITAITGAIIVFLGAISFAAAASTRIAVTVIFAQEHVVAFPLSEEAHEAQCYRESDQSKSALPT